MGKEVRIQVNPSNISSEGYAYGILKCLDKEKEQRDVERLFSLEELKNRAEKIGRTLVSQYSGNKLLESFADVYSLILQDPLIWDEFEKRAKQKDGKLSKEDIFEVRDFVISLLVDSGNPIIRERQDDVRNVFNMLISGNTVSEVSSGDIVYLDEVLPIDMINFYRAGVGAVLSRRGSPTSHASILAQALEIPYIFNVPPLDDYCGMSVFVDAVRGEIVINPNKELVLGIIGTYEEERRELEKYCRIRFNHVKIMANIGFLFEVETAKKKGADGVGLFRTEFLFIGRSEPPSEEEQFLIYKTVLEKFYPDKVIIRLLDVGGDKGIPYLELPEERNPFLGLRGIRVLLNNRDLLETQLRALLRASVYGNLGILIPMVSKPKEVIQVKRLAEHLAHELNIERIPQIGIMIEVPSVVFSFEKFINHIDFASIGTNDLTQYIFAADRMNPLVSEYYDDEDDAILNAIRIAIRLMKNARKPIGVCGELAGKRHMVKTLIKIGVSSLSVSPSKIPWIKREVYKVIKNKT
ncbi:phosphoenolpyruvate--protein phosphotransferase [Thermococcus barophilus]|uniref:phosphoenolpyruvate--protein phosphotransferase n=1 Tax=Thermococcus barophilus TaxID=55802 RepID=A0A0S1XE71_THEBA|nr:phosphoenolpyruvate--protein phosphotransferase [Thermococcus barophilus]ALM76024.1 Phosphoenolpyruvate-protein phosphotransferase [Thermococcus barophilus]